MQNSVFISYSRFNKEFAYNLSESLKGKSPDSASDIRKVWVDKDEIIKTDEWWKAIKRGIENSDVFVTLLSPPYMASPVCNLEMRYARQLNKRFVPILFADIDETQQKNDLAKRPLDSFEQMLVAEVPGSNLQDIATENWLHIRKFNWIYIGTVNELDDAMPSLNDGLDVDLNYVQDHTWILGRAVDWEEQKRNTSALLHGKELTRANNWFAESEGRNPQPTQLQIAFINKSQEIEKRNFRLRIAITAVVAVVIFSLLTIWALERQKATIEERSKIMAQAASQRTSASNSYLIGDFQSARLTYELALNILRQLEPSKTDWAVFTEDSFIMQSVMVDEWLINYGQACAQLRDYVCAEDMLNSAIGINRTKLDGYFILADVYQEQNKVKEAQEAITKAKTFYEAMNIPANENPYPFQFARIESKIAYRDHRYDEAISQLTPQLEKFTPTIDDPDGGIKSSYYLEMEYYIGRSHEDENRTELACDTWQKFQSVLIQSPPTVQLLWLRDMISHANSARSNCDR